METEAMTDQLADLEAKAKAATPDHEGFWWGKWRIKSDGTEDMDDPPGDEWEVMHVVANIVDWESMKPNEAGYDERLKVMVPGVSKWQHLENFFWGKEVKRDIASHRALEARVKKMESALRAIQVASAEALERITDETSASFSLFTALHSTCVGGLLAPDSGPKDFAAAAMENKNG